MTIRCEIVSQDRTVFIGDVDIVVLPGTVGEMGILPKHAPVLTTLKYGVVKVRKAGLEELFTIAGGVLVYVVGQVLSKFFIEPLHDLRKAVGQVRFNLAFHAPTIHTPIGRSKESSDEARAALSKNSCELIASLPAIPFYGVIRFLAFDVIREKNMYGKKYMGILRSTFIVDEKGFVEKVFSKVNVAEHATELLQNIHS